VRTVALHPDHLADLRRSGLNDETIASLRIHSARPQDIPKLVGWDPPNVTSALVFPYGCGFCRVKVFPPYKDKDGHTVKYLQRPASGVHLYIPPLASSVLGDPSKPLIWTEGEKKAAKVCQEGIPCIGLGGLWNWLEDGKPIAKLDTIAHVEREEVIYADSDIWVRPDLLQPVYAFARELEGRGAKVTVAVIPPGAEGRKRGLDDFLVEECTEKLSGLKRIPVKHKAFSATAAWHKKWIEAKNSTPDSSMPTPRMTESERDEALTLLQDKRLLSRFLDEIEVMGCVGEEENKAILYLTFTSRQLDQPINLVAKGESGAGKNYLVESVCRFFPREDVLSISTATPKALYYLPEDLCHKIVIIAERHGAEDADYSIRTFQSEGKVSILVPEKEDGRIVTKERIVNGPAVFVETTTRAHLHPENETRTFNIFIDESQEQTAAIFKAQDKRYLGHIPPATRESLTPWHNAQRLLERLPVIIPYVGAITFPREPLRVRRDRPRFLAMIEACTLLHQHQRERQERGRKQHLVASLDDYAIARELATRMLGSALKGATPKCENLISLAAEFGEQEFTRAEIEKGVGWDRKTVVKFLKEAVSLGCIDEESGGKGRVSKYRFVKGVAAVDCPLPTVEEVEQGLSKLSIPGEMPIEQVNSAAIKRNDPDCPVVQREEREARCDTQGVREEKQLSVVQVEPHTPNVPECPGCGFVQPKATGDTYIACQCGKVYGRSRSRS